MQLVSEESLYVRNAVSMQLKAAHSTIIPTFPAVSKSSFTLCWDYEYKCESSALQTERDNKEMKFVRWKKHEMNAQTETPTHKNTNQREDSV